MSRGRISMGRSPSIPQRRGQMLVEWLVGMAIGITLLAAVVSLFSMELRTLREAVWRQRRDRDAQDLMAHLRRELRRAGQSNGQPRSADHEALMLEGSGSGLQVHYRSDSVDPMRATGRSNFRMAGRSMQWRTPSTGGFQQLTDPQLQGLQGWSVTIRAVAGCGTLVDIAVQLDTSATAPSVTSVTSVTSPASSASVTAGTTRHIVARRRNEGGAACVTGMG